jgi:sodium-dependent phosphate transporter
MAALPQFTYIFVVGLGFAFLDAWNIGANDVANAFATSVSSRSLTLIQAMTIGAIMEFTGAVLAGYVRSFAVLAVMAVNFSLEAHPTPMLAGSSPILFNTMLT